MHPDLSPHLHTEECNIIIKKLQDCHTNRTFGKFLGACNEIDSLMNRCLKNERKEKQKKNAAAALKRRERVLSD